MGHAFFICEHGTGGPVTDAQRVRLDAFISHLPSFSSWEESNHNIVSHWFHMVYEAGVLRFSIGDWTNFPKEDLRELVSFARAIGLNLFGDVGSPADEMDLEDIEDMLGPLGLPDV